MPRLLLRTDRGDQTFSVGDRTIIGRQHGVDVRLFDSELSRVHAEIIRVGTSYSIKDMKSSNGTFLNGRQIQQAILRDNDEIKVGSQVLVFLNPDEEKAPPPDSKDAGEAQDTLAVVTSIDAQAVSDRGTSLAPEPGRQSVVQERLGIMCSLAKAIGTIQTVEELLDKILDEIFTAFPAAERGFVMLTGSDPSQLALKAARIRGEGEPQAAAISRTIAHRVIHQRRALLCTDAMADQRFAAAPSVAGFKIRSVMCVPLLAADEALGIIHVDCSDPSKAFSEADLDLLAAIAAQAAIYIRNAQLHQRNLTVERLAAVGETVAGLAHCVKNILNSIQGGAYLVDMGIEKQRPESLTKGWDVVKRNNKLMTELLMDLLTYSKERKPVRRPTDLNKLCTDIREMMAEKARSVGAELRCELDPLIPQASIDPIGIQRCLSNLVSNSIDAMHRQSGVILLSTKWIQDAATAEVKVADNGSGIPKDAQARIFDLFFSTKGSKGTGLGLAVTRKIIQEHGGDIALSSEPGRGAEFLITLPFVSEEPTARVPRV